MASSLWRKKCNFPFHAVVEWVSKDKMLSLLFNLHEWIILFFQEQNNPKFREILPDNG